MSAFKSKSPVWSRNAADETDLCFIEVKVLCAGNPLIREKVDLYIDAARQLLI